MKFQKIQKTGVPIRGLGESYTHSKFQRYIFIFDVFKALYNEKSMTSFFDLPFLAVLGVIAEKNDYIFGILRRF